MASTSLEFQVQLDSGLPLPVLIFPESELGILINAQSIWSGQSFKSLIDEILKDKDASIEVQDHNISSLERFTTTKTCRVVRARFDLALEDRGCPWNCLEIEDRHSGFKGPRFLENGASLQKWQLTNPKITSMNRSEYAPVQDAKSLDKWLLISEKILALRLTSTLGLQHGYLVLQARKLSGFGIHLLTIKKSGQTLMLMMTTDYFRNHGQGLTFTPDLHC